VAFLTFIGRKEISGEWLAVSVRKWLEINYFRLILAAANQINDECSILNVQ